jgi:hypothetical protein
MRLLRIQFVPSYLRVSPATDQGIKKAAAAGDTQRNSPCGPNPRSNNPAGHPVRYVGDASRDPALIYILSKYV